ncbi:MAG TPA: hypothetical protein VEX18_00005 [Polyangiaceae bacterium]|nr:hypothetical protein [Polyangiaceae bacterium]
MALGLTGGEQEGLLRTTLNTMRSMQINSDADPGIDVEELTLGLDPSVAGGDVCNGPKYGCGASVAAVPAKRSGDPTASVAAFLTVLAGVLMMRRRRR